METIDVAAASTAYDLSACVPVRYTPSPHLGRRWVPLVLSKMTAKGMKLSNLCSFILEPRCRPVVRCPLSSLAVVVHSLPYVASPATCSPHVIGRRPPVQQHCCRHCHCVLLLPPRSLVARCSSLRTPPPLAAANRRSSSSQMTPLLLSSVFFFALSLASSTVLFDAVPSVPGRGAAVASSAPPPGLMKSSSSSSRGCR